MPTDYSYLDKYLDAPNEEEEPKEGMAYLDKYLNVEDMPELSETEPASPKSFMDQLGHFGTYTADVLASGLGPYAAGLGAGLGAGVQTLKDTEGSWLDRLGSAGEAFVDAFPEGRKDYFNELEDAEENLPTSLKVAGTILGAAPTLAFAPLKGLSTMSKGQKAAQIGKTTALQAGLGFAGSRGETLEDMAYDAAFSGILSGGADIVGPMANQLKSATVGKAKELFDAASDGVQAFVSKIQNVPVETMVKYDQMTRKDLKNWAKKMAGPKASPDDLDAIAKNITEGFRKGLIAKSKNLSKQYGEMVEAKYGKTAMSPEHLKHAKNLSKQIDELIADADIESEKGLIEELTKIKNRLKGDAIKINKKGQVTERGPLSYQNFFKINEKLRSLENPLYQNTGRPLASSEIEAINRAAGKLMGRGENEGMSKMLKNISPEIAELNNQISTIKGLQKKMTESLIREKGSTLNAVRQAARQKGTGYADLQELAEAAPYLDAKDQILNFSALEKFGGLNIQPESFASRAILMSGVTGAGAYLGTSGDPLWSALAFGATGLTTPASSRAYYDAKGAGRRVSRLFNKAVGPTREAASQILLNTPAGRRQIIEGAKDYMAPEEEEQMTVDDVLLRRLGQ